MSRRGGRTVRAHPGLQIVWPMVSCVTAGLTAPGVRAGSGSELCAKTGVDSVRNKAAQETGNGPFVGWAWVRVGVWLGY